MAQLWRSTPECAARHRFATFQREEGPMDDDAERGLIFFVGVLVGLLTMWLIVRERESNLEVA